MPWAVTVSVIVALLSPCLTHAQDPAARQHIQDARTLPLSQSRYSTLSDARTTALNPAGLGLLDNAHLHYSFMDSEALGDGHGLYLATPLLGGLGFGAAIEWSRAPGGDHFYRSYQAALGLKLFERLAIGLRYHGFGSEEDVHIDSLHSVGFGAQLRLVDTLAASFVGEHLNTPRFDGRWIEPTMRAGLGWSGWGGRLHLDASYRIPKADTLGSFQGSASVEPLDGFTFFAQGRGGDDPTRFGGGIEARLGPLGLAAAAYANVNARDEVGFDGFTTSLRVMAPAEPSLFRTRDRWIALNLPAALSERSPRSPFGVAGPSFTSMLTMLQQIADDASVHGVVLHIDGLAFGFGQLYELHAVISEARRNGKHIIAHLRNSSTRSYYLASAAERIYLAPARTFSPRGLALTMSFYNSALLKLGVKPEFVKIDRYKSAPEAYIRDSPTAESREQIDAYLDAIYHEFLQSLATSRSLSVTSVQDAIDQTPMRPETAIRLGLIDGTVYRDELAEAIQRDLDLDAPPTLREGYHPPPLSPQGWDVRDRLAIVYIDGLITDGPSIETPLLGEMATGAKTIEAALAGAAADPSILAIVLRINSPGGSATGSDTIHHAVKKAAEAKPVIVSMGNIAASGGYYAAVAGDHIFALPTTLTGSIGIFFGKPDLSGLYRWLGVSKYTFTRGRFADIYSFDRPWEEIERAKTFDNIEFLYEVFVERVAEGREMTPEAVRAVGEGHIWSGERARAHGLTDQNGGLLAAIAEAKKRVGVDPDARLQLVELPPRSAWSAFNLQIPLLPSLQQEPVDASATDNLVEILEVFQRELGGLPSTLLFRDDEALMMLPFEWSID